jgi:hypothetical protein
MSRSTREQLAKLWADGKSGEIVAMQRDGRLDHLRRPGAATESATDLRDSGDQR